MSNKTLMWAIPLGVVGLGLFVFLGVKKYNSESESEYVHENIEFKYSDEDALEIRKKDLQDANNKIAQNYVLTEEEEEEIKQDEKVIKKKEDIYLIDTKLSDINN